MTFFDVQNVGISAWLQNQDFVWSFYSDVVRRHAELTTSPGINAPTCPRPEKSVKNRGSQIGLKPV